MRAADRTHDIADRLRAATDGLQQLIDSGVFFRLPRSQRRRLVRPVIRLYRRAVRVGSAGRTSQLVGAGLAAAAVLTLAGCPTGAHNNAPSVWFEHGEYRAAYGQSVRITAEVRDDDGDLLSFAWYVDGEPVADATRQTVEIVRTPQVETTYLISVMVSDGDMEDHADVSLRVAPPASSPSFGAAVRADFLPTDTPSMGSYGATIALVDLDGDNDPDFLDTVSDGGGYTDLAFVYLENHCDSGGMWFFNQREDPFGLNGSVYVPTLSAVTHTYSPTFADFDNDGDFDAVAVHSLDYGNEALAYLDNRGTPEQPLFDYPRDNYAGLPAALPYGRTLTAGDIDGDGDIDLFHGGFDSTYYEPALVFIRNDGSAEAPQFAPPVYDPFGVVAPSLGAGAMVRWIAPVLADLDADGDLDLLVAQYGSVSNYDPYYGTTNDPVSRLDYFPNTGTAEAPVFASPSADLFGLSVPDGTIFLPAIADVDGDGDLDMIAGLLPNPPDYDGYSYSSITYDYIYAENQNFP